jgi:pimeloyl-ACP methyl ester carboxylesterase
VSPATVDAFLRLEAVDRGRAVSQLYQTRPARSGVEGITDVMSRVPPRVWSKVLSGIAGADARSLLQRVQAPTLIIHDPGNSYIPVAAASYLHEHIAGSRLEITEEYGLYPFGESVYRMIESFIENVTTGRAP